MQERPPCAVGTSKALTFGLLLFLVGNAFVLSGIIWLASPEPYKETVLKHSAEVLRGVGGDDSWGAMQVGLDHARERPSELLYTKVFFTEQFRFQYPPSALFALAALHALAPDRVQTNDVYEGPWPAINTIVGWAFILVTMASVAMLLEDRLGHARPDVDWQRWRWPRAAVVIVLVLTFYPVVKAFTLGQIQVWINGLFALGLLAWLKGRKGASGVLIGIVSLIKPHYGLVLIWAVLRKEFRFAAASGITIAIGLVASAAVYGLANHVDYVHVVSFLSQRGEAYFPNQSVNGLLNRLMSIRDPQLYVTLDLPAGKFPPFTPWIYGATLVSSAVLLISALLPRRTSGDSDRTIDFSIMALTCTMASPIAWEHHYGITLPIYAVLLASCVGDRSRLAWLALSYVLVSTYLPVTNALAASSLNILQSALFAGAVVLLLLLYRSRRGALAHAMPAFQARGDDKRVTKRGRVLSFFASAVAGRLATIRH